VTVPKKSSAITRELYAEALADLFAPIQPFLDDVTVSQILINGPSQVFVERRGQLELTEVRFASDAAVFAALRNIAQFSGTQVDESHPILEARLPDGSKLEAILSPLVAAGPAVAIRRFSRATMTLEQLVEHGSLGRDAADALAAMVIAKCNILIAGGTGSGKTSVLNALAACAPARERVIVLEDTRELGLTRQHVLSLQARKPDEHGLGAVGIRELLRAAVRMRPDRLIIGDLRGVETLELLQEMASGHRGCLGTLQASHPSDALTRLETLCTESNDDMPLASARAQLGAAIDVIVQLNRMSDGSRKLTHITEVVGFDPDARRYELRELFVRRAVTPRGDNTRAAPPAALGGAVLGRHNELKATGVMPTFAARLEEYGVSLPTSMLFEAAAARLPTSASGTEG
jgi:pilus assembly protein CpaF